MTTEKNIDAVATLREALTTVANWTLPETGKTWDDGTPTSYQAEYGSNGARDYMRAVASAALAATDRASTVAKNGVEVQEVIKIQGRTKANPYWCDLPLARRQEFVKAGWEIRDLVVANATPKLEASAATQQAWEDGIRGPLTDTQRDHARNLYCTLHHLGPDAMEDVVRQASVNGYVNGRLDFGITEEQRAAVGEILGMVANDHMTTAEIRRIYAKSWECAWSVVGPQYVAAPISEDTAKAECGACNGSGWVPRDADIGTEQECFSCDGSGLAEEEAPAAPGSIGNAQAVEIAARIFGFKPHKQTEEDKAMWIELSNAYVLADRAARVSENTGNSEASLAERMKLAEEVRTKDAQAAATSKDWPEDFPLENGNYQNNCSTCGETFMGYKRRYVCKECAHPNSDTWKVRALASEESFNRLHQQLNAERRLLAASNR